jgi:hypothetical protein
MAVHVPDRFKVANAFWIGLGKIGLTPAKVLSQTRLPVTLYDGKKNLVTTAQFFALWRAVGVQADRLGDEGFADAGLTDEQRRTGIVEPSEGVDFLDLCLRDRAIRRKVEVLERRTHGELGGFDAVDRLAFLTMVSFGL